MEEGGFFGSPKIIVTFWAAKASQPGSAYPSLVSSSDIADRASGTHIKLSFKAGNRDPFAEDLKKALSRKAWVSSAADVVPTAAKRGRTEDAPTSGPGVGLAGAAAATASAPLIVPTRVGLAGVLEAEAARAQASRALATSAFSDLEELIKYGKKVAEMAEGYARELQRTPTQAGQGGSNTPQQGGAGAAGVDAESEAAGSLLAGLGIITPVTRDAAGSLFITELARQLASFLIPRLARTGGMAPLTDVYVAYNRARGTDPVSPEDLLAAAKVVGPPSASNPAGLQLGLHLATLPGGSVQVLQLDTFRPEEVQKRLLMLIDAEKAVPGSYPFITAHRVSTMLGMPPSIAEWHLQRAEAAGALARDDALNGLRFYRNLFLQPAAVRA